MLRTRLFVQDLEARDNPSGPTPIDPYGNDTTPAQTDTTGSGNVLISIVTSVTTAASTTTTSTDTTDVNSIYKTPLLP